MIEPEFLEADVVLFLHDQALREYGGMQGLKSEDLLHSALARPADKLAYVEPGTIDLYDLAAAYACGIVHNHAFNDGSKRTAWGSCVLFLKVNGIQVRIAAIEVIEHVAQLASHDLGEDGFSTWLRSSNS